MVEPVANEKDQHPQEVLRDEYCSACEHFWEIKQRLLELRCKAFPVDTCVILDLPSRPQKAGIVIGDATCPPDLIPVRYLETTMFDRWYTANCVQLAPYDTAQFPVGTSVLATRGSARNVPGVVCYVPECPSDMIAVRLAHSGNIRWYEPKQLTLAC